MRALLKLCVIVAIAVGIQLLYFHPQQKLRATEYEAKYVGPRLTAYIAMRLSEEPRSTGEQRTAQWCKQAHDALAVEFYQLLRARSLPPIYDSWEYAPSEPLEVVAILDDGL